MFFTGIEGHKSLLKDLESRILTGQMSGSYLFEGPKGIGKFQVAKMTARYTACVGTQDDSCTCPTCRNFVRDPDVFIIGDHDNSVIKAEEMEYVEDFLGSESHKGSSKVLLINDVDRLSHSAADNLLKILEEPETNRLILMTSSFPEDITKTLYSRVEKVFFRPLSTEAVLEVLKIRGDKGARIEELAKFSKFMLHSYLSDPEMYSRQLNNAIKFLKYLKKMDEDPVLSILEEIQSSDGDTGLITFVEMVVLVLSDISKLRMGAPSHIINTKKFEIIEDMSQSWDESIVLPVSNLFQKLIKEYKSDIAMIPKYRAIRAASTAYNTVRLKMGEKEKSNERK